MVDENIEFSGSLTDQDKEKIKHYLDSVDWKDFLSSSLPNDELWFYRFPDSYWGKLKGQQGYIIVRNGKLIDYRATIRN